MTMRNNRTGKRATITLVLAVACWGATAARNGAEQVDSGWSTSGPILSKPEQSEHDRRSAREHHTAVPLARKSTFVINQAPVDSRQDMVLQHVLREDAKPLISSSPQSAGQNQSELRFATRPEGPNGWHPPGTSFAPLQGWHTPSAGPQLTGPALSPPHDNATETESATETVEEVAEDGVEVEAGEPAEPQPSGETAADETDWQSNFGDANETDCEGDPEEADETDCQGDSEEMTTEGDDAIVIEEEESAAAAEPVADEPRESTANNPADSAPTASEQQRGARGAILDTNESGSTEAEATVTQPKKTPPPLTPQLVNLRGRVRSVLKGYYRKTLNSKENDPWEAMHGLLAYGVQSRLLQGGPRGEPVTAVGWLCYNKPCKNQTLLMVTPQGELRAKYGVGLQGHLGQFLAMLAQSHIAPDYPIRVGKHQFTIQDLIEAEKKTCYPKSELTFKLIAFQYYLDLNEKWVNDQGLEWDIPRVIREELAQPIRGAACGGTHRLSSLSLVVKARQRRGEPLDGEYARAAEFVEKYHRYAFRLQNRDGSLSTAWFQGRGDESDIDRRIKTTGHILEWLCYSLSDEELRQPQTVRAVSYLANLMYSNYKNEWEVGPMCHATHALLLYDERVFQPFDGADYNVAYRPKPKTANRPTPSARRR